MFLKSNRVFKILKMVSRIAEIVLPYSLYRPLYKKGAEFYTQKILKSNLSTSVNYTAFNEKAVTQPTSGQQATYSETTQFINTVGDVVFYDFSKKVRMADITDCDLVICCAFKGRHDVLRVAIMESFFAANSQNIRWMLWGSTEDDLRFIQEMAVETHKVAGGICQNNPLGKKWQTCVSCAYNYYSAKLYAITGSDDFLSHRLIDNIMKRHEENLGTNFPKNFLPGLYASLEWLVFSRDNKTSPMVIKCCYSYETAFQPLGAGRFYTKEFLDQVEGCLFDSTLDRCLDDYGYFKCKEYGSLIDYYTMGEGVLLSVKGDWEQMNNLDTFFKAKTLDLEEVSFSGIKALQTSLAPSSQAWLFKQRRLHFQLFNAGAQTGFKIDRVS